MFIVRGCSGVLVPRFVWTAPEPFFEPVGDIRSDPNQALAHILAAIEPPD
jgi:hypothetical protein